MIDRLIEVCMNARKVIIAAALILAIYGGVAWHNLPVEAYPDLGAVSVLVTTQVPGRASEEIEQQITIPLERQLASTPGLVDSRSSSTFGLSLITLIFRDGTDVYFARQRVTEALAQVTLPNGATPSLGPVTGPAGEIYRYTLESDRQDLLSLSDVQNWVVIPALNQIPGVTGVNNFGGFTKEYQVVLDAVALTRYHVSVNDIMGAISSNNASSGGGRVTRGDQSFVVRGIGMVRNLDELGEIAVTQHSGTPVLIHDLGRVQFGHQVREGILGKDGNPDTIEGIVTMLTGENPSLVLARVHAKVDDLQKQLEPLHIRIVPYIDRDNLVRATTDKVTDTVIEGVGLVVFVLILFLGSPRSAFVTAVTIPLALASVFTIMHFLGMPANLFSLGAIDFGVIVDGAIVVTEAILRLREENPERALGQAEVLGVAQHAGRAIFFSTLIIIVAYGPLYAFEGSAGRLFRPMAYTVSFALFGALLCAVMLIPSLSFIALRKPRHTVENPVLVFMHHGYIRWLGHLAARPMIAYIGGAVALVLVVVLGSSIGTEFLPDLDEGALWIQVQLPSGLSLDRASKMASEVREAINAFPETSYAITQLGRNDSGTDPWTPSHIEMPVGLTPYSSWPHGETKRMFIDKLSARLREIPGISFGISQPIADGMNDLVGGAHSPLVLRVYGDDFREMRRIGNQIVSILNSVPGTASASIFQEPEIPELNIIVDRAAIARYGISVSDVNALIGNVIGGGAVNQVYIGDRVYNITLHMPHDDAGNLQAIKALPLTASSGAQIPLGQLAHVTLETGEGNISHTQLRRQITVRVDNGTRPLSKYLAEAQKRIDDEVKFDHAKYSLQWAGTFEQAQRAQKRLTVALAVMFGVMLVLLFSQFRKMRQALLVLAVVPLATLGGLVALHVRGETLNIATAVGFIALFGVAVQNGIIMVANINRLRREGMNVRNAVLEGAGERFRPVLMTATVASIGMLPAAIATGVGTDVQRGLATVVVGGLGIATLLTLFVLPVYYCELEEYCERRDARRGTAATGETP